MYALTPQTRYENTSGKVTCGKLAQLTLVRVIGPLCVFVRIEIVNYLFFFVCVCVCVCVCVSECESVCV